MEIAGFLDMRNKQFKLHQMVGTCTSIENNPTLEEALLARIVCTENKGLGKEAKLGPGLGESVCRRFISG